MNNNKKIEWEDRLSVGIKLIDDQHKNLFATINELIDIINVISKAEKSATEKKLDGIIEVCYFPYNRLKWHKKKIDS